MPVVDSNNCTSIVEGTAGEYALNATSPHQSKGVSTTVTITTTTVEEPHAGVFSALGAGP